MTATTTARLSLLLSAITLALVVFVALRPPPQPADTASALRADLAVVKQSLADLRVVVDAIREEGGGGQADGDLGGQLDRIEASVATVTAKVEAICDAIESSPFAPSGFTCP